MSETPELPDIPVLKSVPTDEDFDSWPTRKPLQYCPGCEESLIDIEQADLCHGCLQHKGSRLERRFADIGDEE